jgi:starch synthase
LGVDDQPLGRPDGEKRKNLWMLSFEAAGVAQVGGLGAAVTNLANSLADMYNVSVFLPGHGRNRETGVSSSLALSPVGGFRSEGVRRGADGSLHPYAIGMDEGRVGGVRYVLARGLDEGAGRFLEASKIYDGEVTFQKMSLMARAMKDYMRFILSGDVRDWPDIIHAHDWHVVPAAVALKQTSFEMRVDVPLVFTIHLLSQAGLPWHYMSEDWSGVRERSDRIFIDGSFRDAGYREVWDVFSLGKFERFGAYESDFVTSVSSAYLQNEVASFLAGRAEAKSGVIHNCCDWSEKALLKEVVREHGELGRIGTRESERPKRAALRRYLLTKALGGPGSRGIEPFADDGELVLMTGRLDRQKGYDVLLQAVPLVLDALPSAKFLLLMVPIAENQRLDLPAEVKQSVRVVLGRVPSIYKLSYLAADSYAMPSRWEPFGMTALEAMATGNPVVGSRVGGIPETVLDIVENPGQGTGHLVAVEDHRSLARALVSFLAVMKVEEESREARTRSAPGRLTGLITIDKLREMAEGDPSTGSRIRDHCRRRVQSQFGPASTARMAIPVYERAAEISRRRSSLA